MYLSKLELNPRNRLVNKDLGNAHALHQRIMGAFPDEHRENPRSDWDILYRQEPNTDLVLVQSAIVPDWSRLPQGYLTNQYIKPKPMALMLKYLKNDQVLHFRLKANPSKRDTNTRKTVELYRESDQLAWIQRQAQQHGFTLIQDPLMVPLPNIYGRKAGKAPIKIFSVLFEGTLQISSLELFHQALLKGIGRGRSYGCGLLSLAKAG